MLRKNRANLIKSFMLIIYECINQVLFAEWCSHQNVRIGSRFSHFFTDIVFIRRHGDHLNSPMIIDKGNIYRVFLSELRDTITFYPIIIHRDW